MRVVDTFQLPWAPKDVRITVQGPNARELKSGAAVAVARQAATRHIHPSAVLHHVLDVDHEHGLVARVAFTEATSAQLVEQALESLIRADGRAAEIALVRVMGYPENTDLFVARLKDLPTETLRGILAWSDRWLRDSAHDCLRARGDPRWHAVNQANSLARHLLDPEQ